MLSAPTQRLRQARGARRAAVPARARHPRRRRATRGTREEVAVAAQHRRRPCSARPSSYPAGSAGQGDGGDHHHAARRGDRLAPARRADVRLHPRGRGHRRLRRARARASIAQGEALMEAIDVAHNGRNTGAGPARILAVFMGADGVPDTVMLASLVRCAAASVKIARLGDDARVARVREARSRGVCAQRGCPLCRPGCSEPDVGTQHVRRRWRAAPSSRGRPPTAAPASRCGPPAAPRRRG